MAINEISFLGKDREVQVISGSGSQFVSSTSLFGSSDAAAVLRVGFQDDGSTVRSYSSTSFKGINARFTSTAASGDIRAGYLALYLTADGTTHGEALRAITYVEANISTARGAHITLDFTDTAGGAAECSGLGLALGATLMIPDVAAWAPTGTYAAIQAEIYSWGTDSDPAGMTELSFIRMANSGGTGKADVDTDACIWSFAGFTPAADAAHAISSTSLAELPGSSIGFQVKVDGAIYFIPAVIAAEWN